MVYELRAHISEIGFKIRDILKNHNSLKHIANQCTRIANANALSTCEPKRYVAFINGRG